MLRKLFPMDYIHHDCLYRDSKAAVVFVVRVGGTTDLVVGLVSLMLTLFLMTHRRQAVTGSRGFHLAIKRSFVMSDSV